jgi:hypothetical protein
LLALLPGVANGAEKKGIALRGRKSFDALLVAAFRHGDCFDLARLRIPFARRGREKGCSDECDLRSSREHIPCHGLSLAARQPSGTGFRHSAFVTGA